jgi:hypothetical protein
MLVVFSFGCFISKQVALFSISYVPCLAWHFGFSNLGFVTPLNPSSDA